MSKGLYDLEYLEALFQENQDALDDIEMDAQCDGIGPRAVCKTVSNVSSVKVDCRESIFVYSNTDAGAYQSI